MSLKKLSWALCMAAVLPFLWPGAARAWSPKQAPLMTKWARQVDPKRPWPEYPRPQMTRVDWLNLNGVWEYQPGTEGDLVPTGRKLSGEILVPYPVESALSGVMEHHDRLWYRRRFVVPPAWRGRRVMLNFGAVDFESEVYINGKSVGVHRGGYLPFSYDITPFLTKTGPQELIVRVFDATDLAGEPRGKQTTHPGGIMYTPTTGIWQTVWLEPVARTSVRGLKIVPNIDTHRVSVTVNATAPTPATKAVVTVLASGSIVKTVTGRPGAALCLPIANQKLWSPDHPFLYDLTVKLIQNGTVADQVRSYFGMRKISLGVDHGVKKMFLNNKFLFEIGPLDQGFWPDGIYTQPNEAALKADIQAMKRYGFNMVRKHIKVEPARWYYWTDHLGLLVWQDMPSPNSYTGNPPPIDKPEFETELQGMVQTLWNSPSIIMWDIFNEGQGQFDTPRLVSLVKTLDPSRLVNQASGGGYFGVGDLMDIHSYPPPACPAPSATQALACGEYGGIGYLVPGHTWTAGGGGYTNVKTGASLEDLYGEFAGQLKTFRDQKGLSAAVYTQITDVETELNGLMTYDRTLKCDPAAIAKANHFQYPVPTYRAILPTSEKTSQTWRYTTMAPAADWFQPSFDDSAWKTGPGGFGTDTPGHGIIGTPWTDTPGDIWLRRTFNPGPLTPVQISHLVVHDYHDEDIDVYINGIPAYSAPGFITSYEYRPLSQASRQGIIPNADNQIAVHCHQTFGGQYIDVGISERIPKLQR
ncbi:MAG: glycoside hydrolase family 2 [Armatimonadetes bacterium]|nr:glycoside hydrolase family 2 [Armatimonadota bacterium]